MAGHHIVALAALDLTNADDGSLFGIHISGNDRLQRCNDLCGRNNGIHTQMGSCNMAGSAFYINIKPVGHGRRYTGSRTDCTGFCHGINVLAHDGIHMRILQNAIGNHSLCAAVCRIFLRGLEN